MLLPVKICGITNEEDACMVADAGADYIGVIIDFPGSPRSITLQRACSILSSSKLPVVALISQMDKGQAKEILDRLQPCALQLIGKEAPALVNELKRETGCVIWKSLHFPVRGQGEVDLDSALRKVNSYVETGVDALVLDTFDRTGMRGGTGKVFDWGIGRELVRQIHGKVFLAGGITPHNVKQAIEEVRPYGIDLSSGVESSIGRKDAEKLHSLMSTVRALRTHYGS
ncbi:MAG: phosphoribosylanthranilate isomerase [Proteobacteria bacterium]|nr:phosphoribosylanthranilate isomerase [Pseudomonadota bacterium]